MSDEKRADLAALCDELERHDREMTPPPWEALPCGKLDSGWQAYPLRQEPLPAPSALDGRINVEGGVFLRNNAARIASELRRLREETDSQRARADAAEALVVRLSRLLALATPWPVQDVLAKLADAADHLLNYHDCDRHGYEGVVAARDAARTIVAALRGDQ